MDKINRFLDSKLAKRLATILGIISAILLFVQIQLPSYLSITATITLIIVIFYFLITIPRMIVDSLVNGAHSKIINSLNDPSKINFIKQINDSQTKLTELVSIQQDSINKLDALPGTLQDTLRSERFIQAAPDLKTENVAEENYKYQAKRYGMGYVHSGIECYINNDGSAKVYREVHIEAHSEISEIDTYINIPEEDPLGINRYIEAGEIECLDDHEVNLIPIDNKPGRLLAKIVITPPLKSEDTLKYKILQMKLPQRLFGIDISPEELILRNPIDYFGWHIDRPTKYLSLDVYFPTGKRPTGYAGEVVYAASAGVPTEKVQYEEQKKLMSPNFSRVAERGVLKMVVDYPLSGLIYRIRWNPFLKK
jgi:hypothetical protein